MANRPSHGLQQRILAFVAARPNREITRNSPNQSAPMWIAKRLGVPEKAVISELQAMETAGLVRLGHSQHRGMPVHKIEVPHGIEPEEWAVAEVANDAPEQEPIPLEIPEDLDLRKLADSLLLAALEVIGGNNNRNAEDQMLRQDLEELQESEGRLKSELSLAKAERDAAIRAKKVAEDVARDSKNDLDQARADLDEMSAEIDRLQGRITMLTRQVRDAMMGKDLMDGIAPENRIHATNALLDLLRQEKP